jgi:protein O-mannosyl-transferase
MSTKNQKYSKPIPQAKPVVIMQNPRSWIKYALLGAIFIITYFCYHYSLGNEFTSWDDVRFIEQNIFIKSFSQANLKMMLFHDITGDYYTPVTMISYALNYHFSGLAPESYYRTNIIIHILNSFLVFFLVMMIFKAMEKNGYGTFKWKEWLALFCALAFAIHPMHVESVSWIAERKDVLYAFFYFLGMIAYMRYAEAKTEKYLWMFLVIICFLLSLLSKPMAVLFPFSLLALDVLLKRDKTTLVKKILLEKVPLFLITVISFIATLHSEKVSGAALQHNFNLFQRILFAFYSFFIYIVKAIIPMPQSSYYPYPETSASGYLPVIFYVAPVIALLVAGVPLYLVYRKGQNNFRVVLFGLGFYFFNMVMVSKIIDSGPYFLADRYTYVCYFGLFFPVAYFVYKLLQKSELINKLTITAVSLFTLFLAFVCYQRTFVWHNSETLWTDVVDKYPNRIVEAYNSLGNYYFAHRDIDKAYVNYQEAINLKMDDPKVYCNMGILMRAKKQYKAALDYYSLSLKIDSNDAITYADRGIVYATIGKFDLAMNDFRRSLHLNPYSEALLGNIAFTYLNAKQFDSAIVYYTRVIEINSANSNYYHYRAVAEYQNGAIKPAIDDFIQNLRIAPHDSECMYYLSVIYNRANDFDNAIKYAQMAENAQYRVPGEYINELKGHLNGK